MGEEKNKDENLIEIKSNEIKSNEIKLSEIKPNEAKPTQKNTNKQKMKAAIILLLTIFAFMVYIVWLFRGLEP